MSGDELTLAGIPGRRLEYMGRPFAAPQGSGIGDVIAMGYEWDSVLRIVADALLPPRPVVCDVGSNIGASLCTIAAARPDLRAFAFEPSDRFRPFLSHNVEAFGLEAEIFSFALGRAPQIHWLHNDGTTASVATTGYDADMKPGRQRVEVRTLDDVLYGRPDLDLLKVDVDGYDFEVLRGASGRLERDRPVLFVEFADYLHREPEEEIAWLQSLGYRRFACFAPSPLDALVGVSSDPREIRGWARLNGYVDLLACHESSPASARWEELVRTSLEEAAGAAVTARTRPGYSKLCELEDFAEPGLRSIIRDVFRHERRHFGASFPAGVEYRKHWEIAMAVRGLRDFGAVRADARVLGVAAGTEVTSFYLANFVREVIATDRFAVPGEWRDEAPPRMLVEPERFAPYDVSRDPAVRERLRVQHMDALRLEFADETFDGVFSSSSIEHFGSSGDIARAAREMGRVLKPDGMLVLATELAIDAPVAFTGWPGLRLFDRRTLLDLVIAPSGLELVDDLDLRVSEATLRSAWPLGDYVSDIGRQVGEGRTADTVARVRWSHYPHIVLRAEGALFGSIHLTLRKPRRTPGLGATARKVATPIRDERPEDGCTGGVNLIGDLGCSGGLGEAGRHLAAAIVTEGVPLSYVASKVTFGKPEPSWTGLVSRMATGSTFASNLLISPLLTCAHMRPAALAELTRGRPTAAYWFWETPLIPDRLQRTLHRVDEIWAASEYMRGIFDRYAPGRVRTVPIPLHILPPPALGRRRFGLPEGRPLFLFNLSVAGSIARKNPDGVVEAFRRAFGACRDTGPLLVAKIQHDYIAVADRDRIARMVHGVGGAVIDEELTRRDMHALIACADAYVSLHRAEGFGLGMAEAMWFAKPVVATDYSANCDFLNVRNGYPVRYRPCQVGDDTWRGSRALEELYLPGQEWAEPDLDDAARCLWSVYADPAEAAERGRRAAYDIREHCSAAKVTATVTEWARERARLGS